MRDLVVLLHRLVEVVREPVGEARLDGAIFLAECTFWRTGNRRFLLERGAHDRDRLEHASLACKDVAFTTACYRIGKETRVADQLLVQAEI
ncbi:MAG: hypothetical protein C0P74_014050 [Gammaproteobacteria bacterium]